MKKICTPGPRSYISAGIRSLLRCPSSLRMEILSGQTHGARVQGGDAGREGGPGGLQQKGGLRALRAAEARRVEHGSGRGPRTERRALRRREGPAAETELAGPVTRGKKREAVTP